MTEYGFKCSQCHRLVKEDSATSVCIVTVRRAEKDLVLPFCAPWCAHKWILVNATIFIRRDVTFGDVPEGDRIITEGFHSAGS